ncbi:ribokinase [Listeria costaricensis]|uniref:ribokinase n=1 Tax=Listeria costaricensis TaxID=2026604 RepID=UPI000C08D4C2|nr:ribokinase [Listeria costaricensis]
MNKVTILGSINLDTTLRMNQLPKPGETVHSYEAFSNGGGKGANQAIAARRNRAETSFIGAVGNDEAGKLLVDLLSQDGVDISGIRILEKEKTGSAIVMVDDQAENSIVIHSGANHQIVIEKTEQIVRFLEKSDFLISQFEINLEAITKAFELAKGLGVKTILNPAPAMKNIPETLLLNTDIFIPNKSEAEMITGIDIKGEQELYQASKKIQDLGAELVIITLGNKGSYFLKGTKTGRVPARVVKPVDTTAAGDTFIGALAAVLKKDYSNLKEAIEYATCASALAVQRFGAQSSIPYADEVTQSM